MSENFFNQYFKHKLQIGKKLVVGGIQFYTQEKLKSPIMLILLYQVEVNQPVVRTVSNISTAIVQSEFGTSVQRGVQVTTFSIRIRNSYFKIISVQGSGDAVLRGTQCALCSLQSPSTTTGRQCRQACTTEDDSNP